MDVLLRLWPLFAFSVLTVLSFGEDWPTHLHDDARSGVTTERLSLPLHEAWIHKSNHPPQPAWPPPGPRDYWHQIRKLRPLVTFDRAYQVVSADGAVYFGSSADDKVYALDASTGRVRWTFFTEGPVRLAPTLHDGKVYVGSDDGCVYCLNAADGELVWKVRPGPADHRLPGNGRLISLWLVRTGIVVKEGMAYCLVGLFPTQGVYLCALDATEGSVLWKKEVDDVSPQGYLLATETRLFVPTGRTTPAIFDRHNGAYLGKFEGQGGAYALLLGDAVLSRSGRSTDELGLLDTTTKEKMATFNGLRMIVDRGMAYLLNENEIFALDRIRYVELAKQVNELNKRRGEIEKRIRRSSRSDQQRVDAGLVEELVAVRVKVAEKSNEMKQCIRWTRRASFPYSMILAGDALFAGGDNIISAFNTESGKEVWSAAVTGRAYGLAVADGRLFVSTDKGFIYCFSENKERIGVVSVFRQTHPYPEDELTPVYARVAEAIVKKTGVQKGYCLVLGSEEGRLAYEIAKRTDLKVIGLEEDPIKVATAREVLDRTGLYGARVSVHQGSLSSLPYVSYFANLVVSDSALLTGDLPASVDEVTRVLRPCGGVA